VNTKSVPLNGAIKSPYPIGQEVANSITHGIGVLLSISGIVILLISSILRGSVWHVVSFTVFGVSSLLLYTMSTLYHAIPFTKAKKVLRIFDHASIYILIAGTYTPFALTILRPTVGWWIFGVIWGAALLGIALKPFLLGKARFISTVAYVLMGWVVVFAWKPLVAAASPATLWFIVAGGISYTAGSIFYLVKKSSWTHPVWHLFVAAGTVCHFFSIMAILPPA